MQGEKLFEKNMIFIEFPLCDRTSMKKVFTGYNDSTIIIWEVKSILKMKILQRTISLQIIRGF